jgi:hypothetical protein
MVEEAEASRYKAVAKAVSRSEDAAQRRAQAERDKLEAQHQAEIDELHEAHSERLEATQRSEAEKGLLHCDAVRSSTQRDMAEIGQRHLHLQASQHIVRAAIKTAQANVMLARQAPLERRLSTMMEQMLRMEQMLLKEREEFAVRIRRVAKQASEQAESDVGALKKKIRILRRERDQYKDIVVSSMGERPPVSSAQRPSSMMRGSMMRGSPRSTPRTSRMMGGLGEGAINRVALGGATTSASSPTSPASSPATSPSRTNAATALTSKTLFFAEKEGVSPVVEEEDRGNRSSGSVSSNLLARTSSRRTRTKPKGMIAIATNDNDGGEGNGGNGSNDGAREATLKVTTANEREVVKEGSGGNERYEGRSEGNREGNDTSLRGGSTSSTERMMRSAAIRKMGQKKQVDTSSGTLAVDVGGEEEEEEEEGGGGDDMQFAHSLQQMMVAEEVAQRHATTSPVQKKKGKTGFRLSSSKKPTIEGYLRKRGQKGE